MKTTPRIVLLALIVLASSSLANNIKVTNVTLTGRDVSSGPNNAANHVFVQCDLSWENSWRNTSNPGNYDAAWVFVKYRVSGGVWHHATLAASGHVVAPNHAIDVPTGGAGAFVYHNAVASVGSFNEQAMRVKWMYGSNGVKDDDQVEVRVFAIEMVYVPQGEFYVGSGATEANVPRLWRVASRQDMRRSTA